MKLNYLLFIILLVLGGCSSNRAKTHQNPNSKTENRGLDFQLNVYEVLRHSDPIFAQIFEKLPPIERFQQIIELDYQNYPDNIVGVTDDPKSKSAIIEQVNLVLEDSLNIKPYWSKYEIENGRVKEKFYQLYFLKMNKQMLEISSNDVIESQPEKSHFNDQPQLLLQISEEKAKKWNQLTERAALDNNGYLAFVIDEEVYTCARVLEPLEGDKIVIPFESIDMAQTIANRIVKNR